MRASAGAASFRRRPTLEEALAEAEAQVQALRAELEEDPAAGNRRQQKARERAARERAERIQGALDRLPELEAKKKPEDREKARCSTTDPDATVMKMGDGGFRPAYNVAVQHGHRQPDHRGGGRGDRRQRCRPDGADGGADRGAV